MQRFLSLQFASSNFSRKLTNSSNSLLVQLSQPFRTFTTYTRPTHHNHNQKDRFFNFSRLTPTRHFYSYQSPDTFREKVHGSLSNPLFMSNVSIAHFSVATKRLADRKVGFLSLRFSRGFSVFNSRGSYGSGWRSRFYQVSPNDVVLGLILANVGVFMLWLIASQRFMRENFMISLDNIKSGCIHMLITSAFSHIDVGHIVSNMIGLYFFGSNIGRLFGTEYLLKLYIAGAIGDSLFYLAHHAFLTLGKKGASGLVNVIMLLDIFLNPRATLLLNFIIPVPAILLGIFLLGKDILRIVEGQRNISPGSAHLGGAVVAGIAYGRIWRGSL